MPALAEAAIPDALAEATRHQPRARAALGAALATGPSHAYLFRGPPGSGKRTAARAFAAELLAAGRAGPRRRAAPGDDRALAPPGPGLDLAARAPSTSSTRSASR